MNYYPVIIPTLNRYEHFKECVESLAACTHAEKTELVIGLDYPPSEKYAEGWNKIKSFLPTIKGFSKITVFEHDHNLGSFGNSSFLIKYISQKYDAWIETEDDNIFSPCFLDYMNKCLEKYKDNTSILAICGYMNPIAWKNSDAATVVRLQDMMAWGLGRWRRTFDELDLNMPEHYMKYVCSHRKILRKMRNNLRDLYQLIFWTKSKPSLDTKCDFTVTCYCIINNRYVISPKLSLVRNLGYDGTGVNCAALANNYLSTQQISKETIFTLFDSLTDKQYKKYRLEWEKWKQKIFQ